MLDGQCRCGGVQFRIDPSVQWTERGLVKATQRELLQGANLLITSSSGNWQLCGACGTSLFHESGQICSANIPDLIPEVDSLHRAAEKGHSKRVRKLLQRGMPVNGRLDYQTPWMLATKHSHQEVCQILLEHGAKRPETYETPAGSLEGQCRCGTIRYRLIAPKSKEVSLPETRLPEDRGYISVSHSQLKLLKGSRFLEEAYMSHGVKVKCCKRCNQGIVYESPDNPNRTYVAFNTLDNASTVANCDWCEVVQKREDASEANSPHAALHAAARDGDANQVKQLLDAGLPIDALHKERTPLQIAASRGAVEICRILLQHGADVARVNSLDDTPQMYRLLLEFGGNPQKYLPRVVHYGKVNAARVLVEGGADLNVPDEEGVLPLHWSAHNSSAMIRFVIQNGADVTKLSQGGGHALGFCALWGIADKMKTLLECGFPPDLPQGDMVDTALFEACRGNHYKCIVLLLRYGADPNLPSQQCTPLMMAAAHGSLVTVNLLLEHGADPKLTDDNGESARDYAQRGLAKCAKRGKGFRLGQNAAGEPALYLKSPHRREYEWTDCHAAIIERLRSL